MYFKIILKTFSYKKHEIHTGDITSREDHGKTTSKPAQGPVTIQLPLPVFLRAVSDSASARHRLSNYSRLTKPSALYKTFLEPLGSEGILEPLGSEGSQETPAAFSSVRRFLSSVSRGPLLTQKQCI